MASLKKRIKDIKRVVNQAIELSECQNMTLFLLEIGALAEEIEKLDKCR